MDPTKPAMPHPEAGGSFPKRDVAMTVLELVLGALLVLGIAAFRTRLAPAPVHGPSPAEMADKERRRAMSNEFIDLYFEAERIPKTDRDWFLVDYEAARKQLDAALNAEAELLPGEHEVAEGTFRIYDAWTARSQATRMYHRTIDCQDAA